MLIKTPCSRHFENIHPINGGFDLGPDTEKFSVAWPPAKSLLLKSFLLKTIGNVHENKYCRPVKKCRTQDLFETVMRLPLNQSSFQ